MPKLSALTARLRDEVASATVDSLLFVIPPVRRSELRRHVRVHRTLSYAQGRWQCIVSLALRVGQWATHLSLHRE